jgi:hypothetical protein
MRSKLPDERLRETEIALSAGARLARSNLEYNALKWAKRLPSQPQLYEFRCQEPNESCSLPASSRPWGVVSPSTLSTTCAQKGMTSRNQVYKPSVFFDGHTSREMTVPTRGMRSGELLEGVEPKCLLLVCSGKALTDDVICVVCLVCLLSSLDPGVSGSYISFLGAIHTYSQCSGTFLSR